MGRLIDADELIKEIHMLYSDDLGIREVIDKQPTAYDPDKVVEKLKYNIIGQLGQDGVIRIPLDKAIEIVKGGEND